MKLSLKLSSLKRSSILLPLAGAMLLAFANSSLLAKDYFVDQKNAAADDKNAGDEGRWHVSKNGESGRHASVFGSMSWSCRVRT